MEALSVSLISESGRRGREAGEMVSAYLPKLGTFYSHRGLSLLRFILESRLYIKGCDFGV